MTLLRSLRGLGELGDHRSVTSGQSIVNLGGRWWAERHARRGLLAVSTTPAISVGWLEYGNFCGESAITVVGGLLSKAWR